MECQIRCMASSNAPEEVSIPEGKVESVCREWLIREDGVLAYKLQTEEIQHHYGHNKERSQLVRSDFQEARTAQKSEEEEAAAMQLAYEKMLKEQEDQDAYIAKQLQEKLLQEELELQKKIEEEDQRIALELQRKEKLRLQRKREEKELKQAEKARAELSSASNSSSIKSVENLIVTKEGLTNPIEKELSLLSLEPPDNLSPDEFEQFVHSRDAELARLLQEQEIKSQSCNQLDQQIAIEAQDRELAKVLQEQERARAKKARERARQKAALAQQQESSKSSDALRDSIEVLERDVYLKEKNPGWNSPDCSFASNFSGDPVSNIAAAIDPTYNASSNCTSPLPQHSSPSTSSHSPPYDAPSYTTGIPDSYLLSNTDNGPAPPYMPIQGTRRTTSLEKKKFKKSKDGCKTQ